MQFVLPSQTERNRCAGIGFLVPACAKGVTEKGRGICFRKGCWGREKPFCAFKNIIIESKCLHPTELVFIPANFRYFSLKMLHELRCSSIYLLTKVPGQAMCPLTVLPRTCPISASKGHWGLLVEHLEATAGLTT